MKPRQLLGKNRFLRAYFDRGIRPQQWIFKVMLNKGGGYGWYPEIFKRKIFVPTGWTFYIGRNVVGHDPATNPLRRSFALWFGTRPNHVHQTAFLAIGLTQCGNSPWINS